MRFGIVSSIDNISVLENLGYDYLETYATRLSEMTEEEFTEAKATVENSKLAVEAICVLLPGSFNLYTMDQQELEDYLHLVFDRASQLGVQAAVFGSGGARRKPADLPFEDAYKKLVEITGVMADVALDYNITIAVEPLNHGETNMINTVSEAAMLAVMTGRENIGALADSYHMFKDKEDMENIRTVGTLAHSHMALLEGRIYPVREDEALEGFFNALHDINYSGRISIEGSTDDFENDAKAAIKIIQALRDQ